MQPSGVAKASGVSLDDITFASPGAKAMQPSTHDLDRSLERPRSLHYVRQPRISLLKAMSAIERGERRPPTVADLPYALEQRLHAAERQELLRQVLHLLAWVRSLLVLEGDESPRE
jgi:hypothetical protein